ncbi:CGNR zinc finger domain-containing protein [Priestia megaterium]|uniref:CGNR zinc finger domain-containing protein n=1 Tax=Priestia megaterium TaxID=1404 RepID=UPI002079526B|nr:CGNR zinc finger domain-containing protein [Priestia megaterium]USL45519.1 CGNR zinc finger domain-containing protein [Priestia megaterium]
MCSKRTFPLISGFLSLDLVNTEVISHGRRHELLVHEQDLLDWLHTMYEQNPSLDRDILNISEDEATEILPHIHEFRFTLRENFERIADGNSVNNNWILNLEKNIENAPYVYQFESGELREVPKGSKLNKILSLLSLDALRLITDGKLQKIKRCSNPDCVLLFIDLTGRRKWCSMKICGNRKKVARFQHKNNKKT